MPVNIGKSARLYRERKRLVDTRRGPTSEYNDSGNRIHTYPTSFPPELTNTTGPDINQVTDPWFEEGGGS
jgi:hypothetical protein